MNSLPTIKRRLKGKTQIERLLILEEEANLMTKEEKGKYSQLYGRATYELNTQPTVTRAVSELIAKRYFLELDTHFLVAYQLACTITENPVQEPREIVAERRKRKPKPIEGGRNLSPIAERIFLRIPPHQKEPYDEENPK